MSDTAAPSGSGAENPHRREPRHRREGVPLDGAPDLGLFSGKPELDPNEFGENPDTETAG